MKQDRAFLKGFERAFLNCLFQTITFYPTLSITHSTRLRSSIGFCEVVTEEIWNAFSRHLALIHLFHSESTTSQLISACLNLFRPPRTGFEYVVAFILGNRLPTWHDAPHGSQNRPEAFNFGKASTIWRNPMPLWKTNETGRKWTADYQSWWNSSKSVRCVIFKIQLSKLNASCRFQMTICRFAMKKWCIYPQRTEPVHHTWPVPRAREWTPLVFKGL